MLEDIRLTIDEIADQFTKGIPASRSMEKTTIDAVARLCSRVANTATDKAMRKMLEWADGDCDCGRNIISDRIQCFQCVANLKKLVGEK